MRLNWYKFPSDVAIEIKAAEGLQDNEDVMAALLLRRLNSFCVNMVGLPGLNIMIVMADYSKPHLSP